MNLQNPNINDGEKYNHSTISPALKQSARDNGPFFSVVIPVYNEQESLRELHLRLTAVLQELKGSYEIIFVDDGSADGSFTILEDLHKKDHRVIVLQFSRNFGHHLAITAGMDAAVGEVVILMDADLEDQPEEIPALFNKLQEGYDVVYGIRMMRQHTLFKRVSSRLFFALMRRMVKGFDLNSGVFRIARRRVIDTVKQCREANRFVVGLISWAGFNQTGVEVRHGKRQGGATKYNLPKQILLAVNGITSFTALPLRMSTYLGVIVSAVAIVCGAIVIVRKIVWGLGVLGWPSLMVVILFLSGVQLLSLGIFGEYLGRALTESQHRPLYVIARRLESEDVDEST